MFSIARLYGHEDFSRYSKEYQDRVVRRAASHAELMDVEIEWRDRQLFLQSKGYMLRPRYRPNWVPSWTLPENARRFPSSLEDYILPGPFPDLIDATRESDGRLVCIKRLDTCGDEEEIRIATMLSSGALANDPRNHCVRVLDVFQDDVDPSVSYLVMPFLRCVDIPPFETVADIVDLVNQLLEGLVFMHEQGVAHRDCAYMNIMMDADSLYTEPYHPVNIERDITGKFSLSPLPRSAAHVKYYFVDFGISTYFPPGQERHRVTGIYGHDEDVPELSPTIPYDPFKVDVFIIGNMLRTLLLDNYSNLEFLRPLSKAMTIDHPDERVDAIQAQELWNAIRPGPFALNFMWRLRGREEAWPVSVASEGLALIGRGARASQGIVKWLADMQG